MKLPHEYNVTAQHTVGLLQVLPFFAISLLPIANYPAPVRSPAPLYDQRGTQTGNQYYSFTDPDQGRYRAHVLEAFATTLLSSMEDMDPEIAKAVNDGFWDMYEPF